MTSESLVVTVGGLTDRRKQSLSKLSVRDYKHENEKISLSVVSKPPPLHRVVYAVYAEEWVVEGNRQSKKKTRLFSEAWARNGNGFF